MSTKKKPQKKIKATKNVKKNTPLSTRILVLNKAIACLTEVIEATREDCRSRKKKFNVLSKIYDPDGVVWMLDETFRQVKWLNDDDRDFLEINVDYDDDDNGKFVKYNPSCVIVNDVLIYIQRLAELASDLGD